MATDINGKAVDKFDTDEEDFDTVLASDITFKGTISFDKPFFIKGKVNGHIKSASDLLIDTGAVVDADIVSDRVYIRGKVLGDIDAARLIYVTATGSVKGDISSRKVVLENGAVFSGRCTMLEDVPSPVDGESGEESVGSSL
ncbi:MAG: polymer-forming cytoskeletal protein [Treponema sp.]|nr:polymer-forming cytoskeletal protein [Treponema sp.]MCR5621874.1 polymer-forming cytoskeletal protein [Treponema sp.]